MPIRLELRLERVFLGLMQDFILLEKLFALDIEAKFHLPASLLTRIPCLMEDVIGI